MFSKMAVKTSVQPFSLISAVFDVRKSNQTAHRFNVSKYCEEQSPHQNRLSCGRFTEEDKEERIVVWDWFC